MAFNSKQLPTTVYKAYQLGTPFWIYTIDCGIKADITDINKLTNIAFYLHHPELDGRPLKSDEVKLIAEWKAYRTFIQPILGAKKSPKYSTDSFEQIVIDSGRNGGSEFEYFKLILNH